jgi:hypothetical protein
MIAGKNLPLSQLNCKRFLTRFRLCFFDVTSIKPRLLATISQLEYNPLTLAYFGHYDDDVDLLIIGDDGGYVSIIKMRQKFLVDCAASESEKNDSYLTPHHLSKRDSLERYNITMYTVSRILGNKSAMTSNIYEQEKMSS